MLLRIIDKSGEEGKAACIEVILESDQVNIHYCIDMYESPFSKSFRGTLDWYFQEYPYNINGKSDGLEIAEKFIKFGQYIGDQFLGEDDHLYNIVYEIEKLGYENLHVRIESKNIDFFDEFWETLVFEGSNYVLAAAANSFVRKITGTQSHGDYPELYFGLKHLPKAVDLATDTEQADLKSATVTIVDNENKLKIFHVVCCPDVSYTLNTGFELLKAEGAVQYQTGQFTEWANLKRHIEQKSPHALHFDGSILIDNDAVYLYLEGHRNQVEATEFISFLVLSKVAVLSLDIRDCFYGKESISVSYGLSRMAQISERYGLGNVIGLNQKVDPWVSHHCFTQLYGLLTTGLSFAQAVVETRKSLQAVLEISQFTSTPLSFHLWPLLNHYGGQQVTFFESAQELTSLEGSIARANIVKRLLGFKTDFISPSSFSATDGQLHRFLTVLDNEKKSVALTGPAGIGKTHYAHLFSFYLLQSNKINFAFYFDFNVHFYSSGDILGMIAPVVGIDSTDRKALETNLDSMCCCFVLDNVFDVQAAKSQVASSQVNGSDLSAFLSRLLTAGHIVIASGSRINKALSMSFSELVMSPLNHVEQKILSANCLREHNQLDKDQDSDWQALLAHCNGNPFLIKSVIPQLASFSVKDLTAEFDDKDLTSNDGSLVEAFYQWQWDKLSSFWKKLLLLCTTVDDLLLEMLMLACDQTEQFMPATLMWRSLGGGDLAFSEGIEIWERSGFVRRLPYGRVIDSRALLFLQKKYDSTQFNALKDSHIQLLFSQLICEGIRQLSLHVVRQQNPPLSNDLLIKRRHWVEHFERLYLAGDFHNFMATIVAFKRVMQQANISNEIDYWSLDFLGRLPIISAVSEVEVDAKIAWLSLAIMALKIPEAKDNESIKAGEKILSDWFHNTYEDVGQSIDKALLPLLQKVIVFLELFYKQSKHWQRCIPIVEKAYPIYQRYELWTRAISALKSLANCYVAVGDITKAKIAEEILLNDIPYENSPPGFGSRQILDIVISRVARDDYDDAQILLNQAKGRRDASQLSDAINDLQATILYQQEQYVAALPYYCKLWDRALVMGNKAYIEQLKKQFSELEEKLGSNQFNDLFVNEVAADTALPSEYALLPE